MKVIKMSEYTFGFIGTGNMGGALACAVAKGVDPQKILLSDAMPRKAESLAEKLGCTASDNAVISAKCQYIFLGVKPQMMHNLLGEIGPVLLSRDDDFVLVTMAAGITTESICSML